MSAETAAPRLILAGNDPPRVAFVRDTKDCGDAPERGPGFIFVTIEGERVHCALLPGQAGIIVAVDSADALDLLRHVLAWPGPLAGGQGGPG